MTARPLGNNAGEKNGMERCRMLSAVKGGASHAGGCCPSTRLPETPDSSILTKAEMRANASAALPLPATLARFDGVKLSPMLALLVAGGYYY